MLFQKLRYKFPCLSTQGRKYGSTRMKNQGKKSTPKSTVQGLYIHIQKTYKSNQNYRKCTACYKNYNFRVQAKYINTSRTPQHTSGAKILLFKRKVAVAALRAGVNARVLHAEPAARAMFRSFGALPGAQCPIPRQRHSTHLTLLDDVWVRRTGHTRR